ncbi:MAG: hypothetical protein NTX79_04000 [Candidatus Micrarchaeota archaeon]|nr:hypothetical protein [Candidatus Micrarchaeota archaeon]
MSLDGFGLLDGFADARQGRRSVVIFSPVGDLGQLEAFLAHVKKLGIDKEADFVFLFRKGLAARKTGLSALCCFEKIPLGTSGCFFAGQALSYRLGYEIIVVADLDAFLDSKKTLDEMIKLARRTGMAVMPLSKAPREKKPDGNYFVVNQWGVFPRAVFEKIGFEIPYTRRGGEDWEFSNRLRHYRQAMVYRGGNVVHEKIGMGITEKLKNPKKYYPYLRGLMLAFSISWQYDAFSYARFFAWFCYYNTFAIMLGDRALAKTVRLQEFSETDIKAHKNARPGIAAALVAVLSIPLTMLDAASTMRSIEKRRMPTPENLGEIGI